MKAARWKISPALLFCLLFAPAYLQAACRELNLVSRFVAPVYASEPEATIHYFGHNFFLIVTRKGTRIVTDPLGPGWYPTPRVSAHVVTVGREHFNHNHVALVQGNPIVLRGLIHSGAEWNRVSTTVRDTLVYNIPVYQNGVDGGLLKGAAFIFDIGPLCIAHLGDLSHPLTEEQVKQMGKVDIALVPIDGRFTMGPDVAQQILRQLKPRIAIPMHYRDNLYLVREFSRGFKTRFLESNTLALSKSALPPPTEIVVLQPRGARSYE